MKILLFLLTLIFLCGCIYSEKPKVLICEGDFDRTILGKTDIKVAGQLALTVNKKKLTVEGSFFDDTYQVCSETNTLIWFEKNCKKRKETEFKSTKEFVDYLLYTNTGGGYFNKLSGYLEIINLPFGMNQRERASYTGQFNCKSRNLIEK